MAIFTCRKCNFSAPEEWEGRCPGCFGLYRAKKSGAESDAQKKRSTFASAEVVKRDYIETGIAGLDEVLGGGLVAGCVVLFGGFRGAGKSTLLVTAANSLAERRERNVMYASSEQGDDGIIDIAHRSNARSERVLVRGNQQNIEKTLEEAKKENPLLVIYDSLQKFMSPLSAGAQGSVHQGSAVTKAVVDYHRKTKTCGIIVNQMSKAGELKGGEDVEHDVDTILVLAFPKDEYDEEMPLGEQNLRVLMVDKNRNGPENEKTYWRMTSTGLEHVPKRSPLDPVSGGGGGKKYRRN